MGKVFTPEELLYGNVPETGAHESAASFIMESLFGQLETDDPPHPSVTAGLPYGSVQMGCSNVRSDIDVLLVYRPDSENTALRAIRTVVAEAAEEYKVPVGAKPLYEGALDHPLEHDVDLDFARHLLLIAQNGRREWMRGDPVPDDLPERCTSYSLLDYAFHYSSLKTRKIGRSIANTAMSTEVALQEALELPGAICRKVYPAVRDPECDPPFSYSDGKAAVMSNTVAWAERTGNDAAIGNLLELADINIEYSQILDSTLEDITPISEYARWLDAHRNEACLLAHTVATEWLEVLRPQATGQHAARSNLELAGMTI